VEANVRWTLQVLRDTPEGKAAALDPSIRLVGAIYDLKTGRVRFLA
jgi:carbonic anhydrase